MLVVHLPPSELLNNSSSFLRQLSALLRTNVALKRHATTGEPLVYPYYGTEHELSKHTRTAHEWSTNAGHLLQRTARSLSALLKPRHRRELDNMEIKG